MTKNYTRTLEFAILILLFQFTSCDLFPEEQNNPVFLEIDSIDLVTTNTEGSDSHNIRDAWISINGEELGVFELPTRVPILQEVPVDVRVFAGIRKDGIQSVPLEYPFFVPIDFNLDAEPGDVVSKQLSTNYSSDALFEFIDNMESSSLFGINLDDFEGSEFRITADELNAGNNVGELFVNQDNPVCSVTTSAQFTTEDITGKRPYLEVDYRGDAPLFIGTRTFEAGLIINEDIILLKPIEEWNKLYLSLEGSVEGGETTSYQVYFKADILGFEADSASAFIDNVKLIRF